MQSAALFLVLLVVGVALALPADPMMMMMMKPAANMQAMARPDMMAMSMSQSAGTDKKTDTAETKKAGAPGLTKMGDKTASAADGAEKKSSDDPSGNKYFPCEQGKVWFRKQCVSTITWSNGNTYYYG